MKFTNFQLIAVAIILVILHFIVLSWYSIEENRWLRVLTSAVLLGAYFFQFSRHTLLLAGALISFFIADIFTLSYNLESSKDGFFIFHGIAFSLLFLFITKKTIREPWSSFQKNYVLIAAGLCLGILLFFGISFRQEIDGIWHLIFFYFHGLALIACLIVALSFFERKANSASMINLFAVLGLLFSDLTAFAAEYLNVGFFYYFNRAFYVVGLVSLVKFSIICKSSQKLKAEELTTPGKIEPKTETSYHDH